ncbi:heavy metal translocating P-type ATPase [Allomyces macrogynus ATCC 38327]|uniref:Heavy metal translocating P-type ATPase n=1 Tax=Allomyces macrogynus (strain ATCC 38327) TaxID=578462 RepID=A0A0L0TB23_ALLM3|nr:heavy metal translocating P-type ATPase [Allomyces macrogynus ATCC 38327]|eukprot:KNE71769.1 heavy metal translocating P-type ATPase [Allomyces macrogynus ATCC 38327]
MSTTAPALPATASVTTTLLVDGMTCASCVRSLETGLGAHPSVRSVAVNLLAGRATIEHDLELKPATLVDLVGGLGYDAEVLSSMVSASAATLAEYHGPIVPKLADVVVPVPVVDVTTTLIVEGMTCASCVRSLESGLAEDDRVRDVAVNLLAGRATITHSAELDAESLVEKVCDLGYDGEVLSTGPAATASKLVDATPVPADTVRVPADPAAWRAYLRAQVPDLVDTPPHSPAVSIIDIDATLVRPTSRTAASGDDDTDDKSPFRASLARAVTLTFPPGTNLDWSTLTSALSSIPGVTELTRSGTDQVRVTLHPLVTSARAIQTAASRVTNSTVTVADGDSATPGGLATLITAAQRAHERHARHTSAARRRFLTGAVMAVPMLVLAMIIGMLLPADNRARETLEMTKVIAGVSVTDVVQFVIASCAVAILGVPLAKAAIRAIRARGKPDMDALVALGVWAAYVASVAAVVVNAVQDAPLGMDADEMHHGPRRVATFFETPVLLLAFLALGRWLEAMAKGKAADAVAALVALQPDQVTRVVGGKWDGREKVVGVESEVVVPSGDVLIGDIIKVVPGVRVPCNGIVVSGSSLLDVSAITGEPIPIPAVPGATTVASGALNAGTATLLLSVTHPAHASTLARIATLVDNAQSASASAKSDAELLADRVAGRFVPIVLVLSVLTFVVWEIITAATGWVDVPMGYTAHTLALQYAVAVLVVACPCAVGLAVPTAVMVGAGVAAKHGVLVKDAGRVLERCARIEYLVADKTGTLTIGKPTVVHDHLEPAPSTIPHADAAADWPTILWSAIAAVEANSAHPLARSLLAHARAHLPISTPAITVTNVHETPGRGLSATLQLPNSAPLALHVGSPTYLSTIAPPAAFLTDLATRGGTLVGVAIGGRVVSAHVLDDPVRAESRSVVRVLRDRLGVDLVMCTGDQPAAAHRVAAKLGIDHVVAHATPEDKLDVVRRIQRTGSPTHGIADAHSLHVVAMVGDGINDAPALASADVGISLLDATDVAVHSASVLLTGDAVLARLPTLVVLARRVARRVRWNLAWALGYNVAGLVWACGALGTQPAPAVAGLAMALSSVSVVLSALGLRWQGVPKYARIDVSSEDADVEGDGCGCSADSDVGTIVNTCACAGCHTVEKDGEEVVELSKTCKCVRCLCGVGHGARTAPVAGGEGKKETEVVEMGCD